MENEQNCDVGKFLWDVGGNTSRKSSFSGTQFMETLTVSVSAQRLELQAFFM